MNKQGFVPLCCGSLLDQEDILERWLLGALRLAGNVNDPLTWCGAAWMTLCGGTWRPPSFVEELLRGNRDQGDRDFDHGRDLIAEKRYS